jgi:hypothetical protein
MPRSTIVSLLLSGAIAALGQSIPDGQARKGGKVVQTWNLKDYRSMKIFLRCRYHDTAVVLYREAPAPLATCTFTFALDKNANFIGKSNLVCRQ